MKILITGGAGYLGSVITGKMLSEGHEVVINSFFAMSTWEILYKAFDM